MKYSMKEYEVIKIEPSKKKDKKYTATLRNKKTKKEVKIHFGGDPKNYEQYYDVLGYYSSKNHLDKSRRDAYYARHGEEEKGYYSALWLSNNFLWPKNI